MKANEFIKKSGWDDAIALVNASNICGVDKSIVDIEDLKRLVESWELVKEHGSLGGAKEYADSVYTAPEVAERLHVAIADVESCMEEV